MSERIDLEQLAMFLKKKRKDRKKKRKDKKKRKPIVVDGRKVGDLDTRSGIVNKLGIKENVIDSKQIAFEKLKKTAVEGSLNLIYALQKDVKEIQSRFNTPQQQPFAQQPFSRLKQQTSQQIGGDRFDSMIQAQKLASENKKNQDRIEKEAKEELKKLDVESKAEVKRIEREAKDEQVRARAEQKALVKEQARINAEQKAEQARINAETERKEKEVARLLRVRGERERKQLTLQQSYTIAQGMRTFTDFAPNPPDIGGGGGLPPLPFNRERDQYDPLEPTPFYRSTSDRIEAPILSDVLGEPVQESVQESEGFPMPEGEPVQEAPVQESEGFPMPEGEPADVSMSDEALLGLSSGMAEAPSPSPKKRGGRPLGSKNKPKPNPSQVAIIGSSSVVGKTAKGKTPANTPTGSANL